MTSHKTTLHKNLRDLFEEQSLAALGTMSQNSPYQSLIAFAVSKDLRELFFATTTPTRKYSNIVNNPSVAVLVDNRAGHDRDFNKTMAVTVLGEAKEVSAEVLAPAREFFLAKHPHLNDFMNSPNCRLFRVAVNKYYIVTYFQQVMVLPIET